MLDGVDADQVSNSAEEWEKVIVKLRSRAMPPPGARRPDNATYDRVATWLETALDRAAAVRVNPGRPGELHRLNRTEYGNAVRDLLGLEIDPKAMLPADEQAHGFSTNAEALSIQPALLDRYLSAAAKIARLAVGDPAIPAGFERYTALKDNSNESTWLSQNERLGEELPLGSRGGIVARHYFPVDGEYVFKVRLDRTDTGIIRGLRWRNDIEIRVDGVRVGQFSIGGTPEFTAGEGQLGNGNYVEASSPLSNGDDRLEVRVPVKAGTRQVIATIVKSDNLALEGLGPNAIPIWSREHLNKPDNPLMISSLLIGGPYGGRVSQESPSRRRLFVCQPASTGEETACATKILTTLARRAYRREPTNDDIQTLVGFYRTARAQGDFDAGIRAGDRAGPASVRIFCSESRPIRPMPPLELCTTCPISSWRHGCRFFCGAAFPTTSCSTRPFAATLHEPAVLERQVRRMLADPRARTALVQNFFAEWLQTRNVVAAHAGSQSEVSLVRRQPARRVRQGDGAVSRRSAERGPQHRRSADVGSDVSQRAARAPLRHSGRLREPFPARHAHRRKSLRPARQGGRAVRDVVLDPDGAHDPRASGCSRTSSPRRRPRRRRMCRRSKRAARTASRDRCARCWSTSRESRCARAVTREWIRLG